MRISDEACSSEMPSVDWPAIIRAHLESLHDKNLEELGNFVEDENCVQCAEGLQPSSHSCFSFLDLLNQLKPHYINIRTILRKFYDLRKNVRWLLKWKKIEENQNVSFNEYRSHVALENLPVEMRKKVAYKQSKASFSGHVETTVRATFRKQMAAFDRAVQEIESSVCRSCNRFMKAKEVKNIPANDPKLLPFLRGPPDSAPVLICKECISFMKKGHMPPLCIQNGLELDDIPDVLKNLNWLEYSLIRRVRPLMVGNIKLWHQSTFTLKGGQRGYIGTILHLPVPIEETVSKVLKDLPSSSDFNIVVQSSTKAGMTRDQLVNMGKVVDALKWLKANNRHYNDININADDVESMLDSAGISDQAPGNTNANDHLLTLVELPLTTVTVTNKDPVAPAGQTSDLIYKLKDMKGAPVQPSETNLDVKAFPEIFPLGKGGMDQQRVVKCSETKYMRSRFRNADRRFINNQYAIFMNNKADLKAVMGSVNITMRKNMNTESILNRLSNKDTSIDDDMSTTFSALRNHQDYWKQRRQELKTMIQYYGPPTAFVTLNPAEGEWAPLRLMYEAAYPQYAGKSTLSMTILDAMIFVRYFAHRVTAAYRHLLGKNGLMGNAIHFFRRTEYQMRGAPHCHGLKVDRKEC